MAGDTHWNGLEIAIIGMACRLPGAKDVDAYWRNLREGVESITFLQESELEPSILEDPALRKDPAYVRAAAIVDGAEDFDASFFGLLPKEAELMDPQHRVFLECAWTALEDAGYDPARYRERIGVYAGARTNTYVFNLFSNPGALAGTGAFEVGLGNDLAFLSTRVSHLLNLRGPAYSLHTACSTALVAVHLAGQALLAGECRVALAGGVAIQTPQRTGYLHQFGGITSPDGHCRAFDAKAQGTLFGNGAGVVVLKRLEDALADGDTIHAVIRGSAINNDGAQKASFGAPSVQGQARVIRDALAAADVDARSVTYVETHGTGTQLGDPIEVRALTKAFRASTDEVGFCALGSVKTNIGHLDAAAGIASLIKAVLCLKHRQLPPTLHFEQPNPQLELDTSPFFVNTTLRDWAASVRRAGVSSFGIGGTNAHVVLEEAPAPERSAEGRPWHLLPLSARTDTALDTATSALATWLEQHPEQPLADVAYTLQVGRQQFQHRRMAVVRDREHAVRVLRGEEPERVVHAIQESRSRPVVFLLPGGGSQYAGMGAGLYSTEPVFRAEVDRLATLFQPHVGLDLRGVLLVGPGEPAPELERNVVALPAIFTMEYALARLWMAWGVEPEVMVGHSLGEYAAACLAGVLTVEDAAVLVALRGQLMDGLPAGAMLSVSLSETELRPLLGDALDLAAVNAPGQCVASGPVEAVEALAATLAARGVEHRRLHLTKAAHSRMLDAVLPAFRARVEALTLRAPERPYVSSLTGRQVTAEDVTRPEYWVDHLRRTVRFQEALREVLAEPARVLLEVGPGQTLLALAKLQGEAPGARPLVATTRHPKDPQPAEAFLQGALGRLWLAGVDVDWAAVHAHGPRHRVTLPTYPFERERYWVPPGERSTPVATANAPVGKSADVADWFYLPAWKRTLAPALASDALATRRGWVVFTDGGPLATRLVALLEEAGQDVISVFAGTSFSRDGDRRFTMAPDQRADHMSLMKALAERAPRPEVFVHLWSLTPQGEVDSSAERFRAMQSRGYYSVLALAQALAESGSSEPVRVEVVSNHVHAPDDAAEALAEKAPMLGVCKVLPQEQQHIGTRCIDVVLPGPQGVEALASRLLAELTTRSRDMMVAYRGTRRWAQEFTATPLGGDAAPTRPLREKGVYLLTGGLGGVGLLLAEHLARTQRARLVLLGRSPLPPREEWDGWLTSHGEDDRACRLIRRVRDMESHGAEVLVLAADVADAARMRQVLEQVDARFGALHGVLHCAGVTFGDSLYNPLTDLGTQASETQFRPKVHGTYVLEEVLRGRSLDFVLLFSSNAAVLGGLGYLAYASANLFLDAFAASRAGRSQDGTPWVSASWDSWPEETKHYAGFKTSMDQYAMTREESAEAVRRLVTLGVDGPVVVATGDLPYRLGVWIHRDAPVSRPAAANAAARKSRKGTHVPPANEMEQAIAAIWQEVLGIEQVGRHESFFDLGGHSLLATRIVGRLRSSFQVELPLAKLFEVSTVAGLAQAVSIAQAEREESLYRELLDQVANVPEDQLEAELARASGD